MDSEEVVEAAVEAGPHVAEEEEEVVHVVVEEGVVEAVVEVE